MPKIFIFIGVIAASVASYADPARREAVNIKQARIQMAELGKAADMFYTDCGRYPSTREGLLALLKRPVDDCKGNWGPERYTNLSTLDPWGNEFVYSSSADGKTRTTISYGADGREGGIGADADIIGD